jgi:hypothetical protein
MTGSLVDQEFLPGFFLLGIRDLVTHGTHGSTVQQEVPREHWKQLALAINGILRCILMSTVFVQSSMPPLFIEDFQNAIDFKMNPPSMPKGPELILPGRATHNKTKHVHVKAYTLVRTTSPHDVKPVLLTGMILPKLQLRAKSTVEPPGTVWSIHRFGDMLFDSNGNMFQPKVGIKNIGDEAHDNIALILHGEKLHVLEDVLDHLTAEEFKHTVGKDESRKVEIQWYRTPEGDKGATWPNEKKGEHVWWEVVEVDMTYEDDLGVEGA